MRKHFGWRVRIPVALLVVAVGLTIAATSFSKTNGTHAVKAAGLACGLGTGQKATGTPIKDLPKHQGAITSLAFSNHKDQKEKKDKTFLAVGTRDEKNAGELNWRR